MGLFKKYVTCIMAFYIIFNCVTLNQFYTITSTVLFPWSFTKSSKLWNERKGNFLYTWLPGFSVSHYIKGDRRSHP